MFYELKAYCFLLSPHNNNNNDDKTNANKNKVEPQKGSVRIRVISQVCDEISEMISFLRWLNVC